MSEPEISIEKKLSELARATQAVGASKGFTERVMSALGTEATWFDELVCSERRLLPFAVLAAVLAVVWAVSSRDSTNEALATAGAIVELQW